MAGPYLYGPHHTGKLGAKPVTVLDQDGPQHGGHNAGLFSGTFKGGLPTFTKKNCGILVFFEVLVGFFQRLYVFSRF